MSQNLALTQQSLLLGEEKQLIIEERVDMTQFQFGKIFLGFGCFLQGGIQGRMQNT